MFGDEQTPFVNRLRTGGSRERTARRTGWLTFL